MPVNNPIPLFSLVRDLVVTDTRWQGGSGAIDYDAAADLNDQREEVRLVDYTGVPCAAPIPQAAQARDIEHSMRTGQVSVSPHWMRNQIAFRMDGVSDGLRMQLQQLMHDRAEVFINPGFGSMTDLAWRSWQHPGSGGSYLDLTGRHTLSSKADADQYFWQNKVPGKPAFMDSHSALADRPRRMWTPAGQGNVFEADQDNIIDGATFPTGTGSSLSGWNVNTLAGLSQSFVAAGFGFTPAPGSLRVYGDITASDYLVQRFTTVAPGGLATYNVGVFLRGLAHRPTLKVYDVVNGDYNETEELELSEEWQFFNLKCYCPSAALSIGVDVRAHAGRCDLEVGPIVMTEHVGSAQTGGHPQWKDAGRTDSDYLEKTSYDSPRTGCAFFSFYVPDDAHLAVGTQDAGNNCMSRHTLFRQSSTWELQIGASQLSYGDFYEQRIIFRTGTALQYAYATSRLRPGEVNSVAVRWSATHDSDTTVDVDLYMNGVRLDVAFSGTSPYTLQPELAADLYLFGIPSSTQYGFSPMIALAARIERSPLDDDQIADIMKAMIDPAALALARQCSGRLFRVSSIPNTAVPVAGASRWQGNLVLKQTGYRPWLADASAAEIGMTT